MVQCVQRSEPHGLTFDLLTLKWSKVIFAVSLNFIWFFMLERHALTDIDMLTAWPWLLTFHMYDVFLSGGQWVNISKNYKLVWLIVPVASPGLVSPGAVTDGVTQYFPQKKNWRPFLFIILKSWWFFSHRHHYHHLPLPSNRFTSTLC